MVYPLFNKMTESFKLWAVMSSLMLLIIIVLCLILRIREKIELKKFRKVYDDAKSKHTFEVDFPNLSGIWSVDKKIFLMLREKNREIKSAYDIAMKKNELINEPSEEL